MDKNTYDLLSGSVFSGKFIGFVCLIATTCVCMYQGKIDEEWFKTAVLGMLAAYTGQSLYFMKKDREKEEVTGNGTIQNET